MGTTQPKHSELDDYKDWDSPADAGPHDKSMDQSEFQGLSIAQTVDRCIQRMIDTRGIGAATQRLYRWEFAKILAVLETKGITLASVTPQHMRDFHRFLAKKVEQRKQDPTGKAGISENSAVRVTRTWNSVIHCVFGKNLKPESSIVMKGFRSTAKETDPLTASEMDALTVAMDQIGFMSDHQRRAVKLYVEIARDAGQRVGSVLRTNFTVGDIDWKNQRIWLRHMKNARRRHTSRHYAMLSERSMVKLRLWIEDLAARPDFKGVDQVVFANRFGKPVTAKSINQALKAAAHLVGLKKRVTTHVFRKTVGTVVGAVNAKQAADQLGISVKVLTQNYSFPTLEDRRKILGLLPGGDQWRAQTPLEVAGKMALDFQKGIVTREELDQQLAQVRGLEASRSAATPYGGDLNASYQ